MTARKTAEMVAALREAVFVIPPTLPSPFIGRPSVAQKAGQEMVSTENGEYIMFKRDRLVPKFFFMPNDGSLEQSDEDYLSDTESDASDASHSSRRTNTGDYPSDAGEPYAEGRVIYTGRDAVFVGNSSFRSRIAANIRRDNREYRRECRRHNRRRGRTCHLFKATVRRDRARNGRLGVRRVRLGLPHVLNQFTQREFHLRRGPSGPPLPCPLLRRQRELLP